MITNGEELMIWKDTVATYFEILPQTSETGTGKVPNRRQECHPLHNYPTAICC
jgi:hypothetical protein